MTTPRGRRATDAGPWRYCARCGKKKLIFSELQWQRGKLMCTDTCIDKMLIGGREVIIAQVLSDGKEELAPVEKVRNPELQQTDDDLLISF